MTPLNAMGRLAPLVVSIVVLATIAAAMVARLLGHPDAWLDTLAFAAFTAVMGAAGSVTLLNGTVKKTAQQDDELAALRQREASRDAEVAALRAELAALKGTP